MSEDTPRSISEIETDLEVRRQQLTASVRELAAALDPQTQARAVAASASARLADLLDAVRTTVADARDGDRDAVVRLAVVAGALAIGGALILRRLRR